MKSGFMSILKEVDGVEILLSLAKQPRNNSASTQKLKQHISANISPVTILISKQRVRNLQRLVRIINSSLINYGSYKHTSLGDVSTGPRISEFADVSKSKIRLACSSVELLFCEEANNVNDSKYNADWKVPLQNIMKTFLCKKILLSQPTKSKICEAQNAAFKIAFSRIQGLGFSKDKAQVILEMVNNEFTRLKKDEDVDSSSFMKSLRSPGTKGYLQSIERNVLINNAIDYVMRCLSEDCRYTLDNKQSVLLSLSCGLRVYLDKLLYDWRLSLSLSTLMIRSSTGLGLVTVIQSNDAFDSEMTEDGDSQDESLDDKQSAISMNMMMKGINYDFGEGGSPLSIYADDWLIKSISENEKYENQIFFSVGIIDILFVEKEISEVISVMEIITTRSEENFGNYGDTDQDLQGQLVPTKIIGSIFNCDVIFYSNEDEPFTKISLHRITTDLASNSLLFDDGKSALFTASSKSIDVFDLSFHGQGYDQVITGGGVCLKKNEDAKDPFCLKLAISRDKKILPTELLIVICESKVFVLRRFVYELLQYFLSTDYGVGRIMFNCFANSKEQDKPMHPLSFQVHVTDSSIILPKSSDSDDLLALTVSKLVLSNSYEKHSWSNPRQGKDNDIQNRNEDDSSCLNSVENGLLDSTTHNISEYPTFDKSFISRIRVIVMDTDVFIGISNETFSKGYDRASSSRLMKGIGEVIDGNHVFSIDTDENLEEIIENDLDAITDLRQRRWKKVTTAPTSLEVISDFLPSQLRVLIQDIKSVDGLTGQLSLDLCMSQFYTILSLWYGNMQELPVLFPYSPEFIHSAVNIPDIPDFWPDYGTQAYVERMSTPNNITFEVVISLPELEWHCRFDNPTYFSKEVNSAFMMNSSTDKLSLQMKNLTMQVDIDSDKVMRVGFGATSFIVHDERHSQTIFPNALHILGNQKYDDDTCIDMTWGLQLERYISSEDLNLPFQVSVFMTPDRWCLVNLAMEDMDTCTSDLAFLWVLIDYFSNYYLHEAFGNPYFTVRDKKNKFLKETFAVDAGSDEDCLNIDFRLWLIRPRIVILSDPADTLSPAFLIKSVDSGLFYRYKTIGYDHVSQEIGSKNLDMMKLESYNALNANIREVFSSGKWINILLRSMNMVLIYDKNTKSNHTDIHVNITLPNNEEEEVDGIEFPYMKAAPVDIPLPKICKPVVTPFHLMGPVSCEIDLMGPDNFLMAIDSLSKFIGPYQEEKTDDIGESDKESNDKDHFDDNGSSFSVFVNTCGLKVFISDPLRGVYLPIVVVNVPELKVHCSRLLDIKSQKKGISNPTDLQTYIDANFWVDYYKSGPTHSWEPLVEPYKCIVLFEKSDRRGHGITVDSECPFHINMSGAFFETLAFAARSFAPYILNMLGLHERQNTEKEDRMKKTGNGEGHFQKANSIVYESIRQMDSNVKIKHEKASVLNSSQPTAFSLINLIGDDIRFHQQKRQDSGKFIQYLEHKGTAALAFPATRSWVINLDIVEIPVYKRGEQIFNETEAASERVDSSNYIDIQIPGFSWSRSISVDITGKHFVGLQPKSSLLQVRHNQFRNFICGNHYLTDLVFG